MRARHRMRGVISPLYLPLGAQDATQARTRRVYAAPMTVRVTTHRCPPRDPRVSHENVSTFFPLLRVSTRGRDRKPLHLSNHRGPTTFASPCRMFPSRPHPLPLLTAHRRRLPRPRSSPMDGLPGELCFKIFHLLDHQSLAVAPQVCRKWNALTCDDELWRKLFEDRWGADATAFYAPEPEGSKPWKDVFVVQDRCDRYGLGVRIIREGNDYYLIYQGEIQSYLGTSCHAKDAQPQSAEAGKRQISDRILFFLGDLETAYADAKRVKL